MGYLCAVLHKHQKRNSLKYTTQKSYEKAPYRMIQGLFRGADGRTRTGMGCPAAF